MKEKNENRLKCVSCNREIKGPAYKVKGKPQWQCETCFVDEESIEE